MIIKEVFLRQVATDAAAVEILPKIYLKFIIWRDDCRSGLGANIQLIHLVSCKDRHETLFISIQYTTVSIFSRDVLSVFSIYDQWLSKLPL